MKLGSWKIGAQTKSLVVKEEGIVNISHEAIYQHIWRDRRTGGTLYKHLRHHGKKYNKRSSGKAGRGCIPRNCLNFYLKPLDDALSRRTLRKARANVRLMVADQVSPAKIKRYFVQWACW